MSSKWCLGSDSRVSFLVAKAAFRWCGLRLIPSLLVLGSWALADSAAFDLPGPRIEVKVTRDGKTLPIAEVPNLEAGDRLWLHPEIPASQSAHYLLIVAFLRGSTNPPPEQWFVKAETWNKNVRKEGVVVTVPDEAHQALLFLI
jgi:hypothetical protein